MEYEESTYHAGGRREYPIWLFPVLFWLVVVLLSFIAIYGYQIVTGIR